jgi:hypothetical protein
MLNKILANVKMLAKRGTFTAIISAAGMLYVATRVYINTVLSLHTGLAPPIFGQWLIYSRTAISINYFNDGLVRRGLGGTIASMLSDDWATSGLLFSLTSLLWAIGPLALLIRQLSAKRSWAPSLYMAIILVLSPQTFLGWSRDLIRTDLLVIGFIAWATLATMAGRRSLGLFMLLAGFLAHETAVIFGLPLLLVLNAQAYASGELDKRSLVRITVVFVGGLILIVLAQSLLSAPSTIIAGHMLRAAPPTDYWGRISRDVAIYVTVAGIRSLRTAICYNIDFNPQYYIMALFCLVVLSAYVFILPIRRHLLAAITAVLVPVVFMLIIAADTGRWLKMGVSNAWLLAAFYQLRDAEEQPSLADMVIGSFLFFGLLAMGHTPYDNVNASFHKISLSLGYRDPGRLEDWLNHCDPVWRTAVYGTERDQVSSKDLLGEFPPRPF